MIKDLDKRVNELKDKLSKINLREEREKKDNKKYCLFMKNMNDKFEEISDLIDEYILDDKSNLEINSEINEHIENVKNTKKIIDIFAPYILHYQIMNDLNNLR